MHIGRQTLLIVTNIPYIILLKAVINRLHTRTRARTSSSEINDFVVVELSIINGL